ncbi:hypothetical protein PRIC1_008805 [Phytophthora ramorum]
MGLQEEQTASREFMLALLKGLDARASSPKELEVVVEQILPVLVPAIVHLLKAVEASEGQDEDSEDGRPPIRPLDHLARFMMRRNPRHTEPVRPEVCTIAYLDEVNAGSELTLTCLARPEQATEIIELQALARRLLRK